MMVCEPGSLNRVTRSILREVFILFHWRTNRSAVRHRTSTNAVTAFNFFFTSRQRYKL